MPDDTAAPHLTPLRFDVDGWCVASASVTHVAGRRLLLLPFAAPVGSSRGRRFIVKLSEDDRSRQRTMLSVKGRAAIVLPTDLNPDAHEVTVRLRRVRDTRPLAVPADFATLLDAGRLALDAVPEPERAQLLHMINESATAAVRAARLAAAVEAVRVWSRRAGPA